MAGARVLVIDDDRTFIDQIQAALHGVGELRATACGQDGLRTVEYWTPDVVMLDLLLHDVDGFALLERLTAPTRSYRPAILCLIDGLGAGMREVPFVGWPVGTLVRSAPPAQMRFAVLRAAQARAELLSPVR